MEIRIVLDRVEPPGGRLRVVPGAGHAHRPGNDGEIRFTGWLGLLKAPSLTGVALHCHGLVEDDAGILHTAADASAHGSRPLELALACEDAGAAFARRDDADQARPLLEQATGTYERLGAARDLARAEAVLRAAGIRRGRRGTRGRTQFGWHSLTPTEHTVADLVADGLSNPRIGDRLYISRRTVQTHLAHLFTKLDTSPPRPSSQLW